jgi:hypothetical protein
MKWSMLKILRGLIALALIVGLTALGIFALAVHSHADNGFHQDCVICKAAAVSQATILDFPMMPEHPLQVTGAQVGTQCPVTVARLSVERSSPRAPPLS